MFCVQQESAHFQLTKKKNLKGLSASSVGDLHSILSWSFAYTGNQLDPSRCRVFGVGWSTLNVTAGVDETFYITAVDLYNHSFFGRPPVFYALIGDLSAPAVVLPNDPSTYSVTYHGTQAGVTKKKKKKEKKKKRMFLLFLVGH